MLNVVAIMGRLVADPELRHHYAGNQCVQRSALPATANFATSRASSVRPISLISLHGDQQAEFVSKLFPEGQPDRH